MNVVVMEYKVVDYYTFLDKLKMYELNWLLPNLYYATKAQLESTRFISYIIAQSQATKPIKLTDIMQFEWDKKETKNNTSKLPPKQEIERLKQKVKAREKQINTHITPNNEQ